MANPALSASGEYSPITALFGELSTREVLTPGVSPDAVRSHLARVAAGASEADQATRELVKSELIQILADAGVRRAASIVDAAFLCRGEGAERRQGRGLALRDPEPWPDCVSGRELLDTLVHTFERFLSLPEGASEALALWTVHTHAHEAASVSPVLALTSPEKRCGKTTALTVLSSLVPRALTSANLTTAVLFRAIEEFMPTLLIDEADTFMREREELRGVLNSGHFRPVATVIRLVGEDHEPRQFSTWCPKVIAMIGDLPGTLADRSVSIRMARRGPTEVTERVRLDRLESLVPACRQAARWASDHLDGLRSADPDIPQQLNDRAADNWRPLLAIADAVGGSWSALARKAALVLSGHSDTGDDSPATMALSDIRRVFMVLDAERLPSGVLVDALTQIEERPWGEWRGGRPISARGLAKLLARFGIRPRVIRIGDRTPRGYQVEQFADAFRRYLPSEVQRPQPAWVDGILDDVGKRNGDLGCCGSARPGGAPAMGSVAGVAVPGPLRREGTALAAAGDSLDTLRMLDEVMDLEALDPESAALLERARAAPCTSKEVR